MKHPVTIMHSMRLITPPSNLAAPSLEDCLMARLRPEKRKPPNGATNAIKTVRTSKCNSNSLEATGCPLKYRI